jgi:hypothetical protein
MASKRRTSVWDVLARLGHRGDRDGIIQHVFEATSRVALRSGGGESLDGGDFLVETFEALGTTKDWPPSGSRQWTRLREAAVRRILARLAREGLLDAVSVAPPAEGNRVDACGAAEPRGRGDGDPARRRAGAGRAASRRARGAGVWRLLAGMGYRGPRDRVCAAVLKAADLAGIDVVRILVSLDGMGEYPAWDSPEWGRLRERAVRRLVEKLGAEGNLDAIRPEGRGA